MNVKLPKIHPKLEKWMDIWSHTNWKTRRKFNHQKFGELYKTNPENLDWTQVMGIEAPRGCDQKIPLGISAAPMHSAVTDKTSWVSGTFWSFCILEMCRRLTLLQGIMMIMCIYIYIYILCDFLCSSFADIVLKIFNNHNHQQSWVLSGLQPFSYSICCCPFGQKDPHSQQFCKNRRSFTAQVRDMGPALICPDRQHTCQCGIYESHNIPFYLHEISMNPHWFVLPLRLGGHRLRGSHWERGHPEWWRHAGTKGHPWRMAGW